MKSNTLDYIVQKSVYYISKHLGGYKVVYVNSKPPSSEQFCTDSENKEDRNEKTNVSKIAGIIAGGITLLLVPVIVIAGVRLWHGRYNITFLNDFLF